MNYWMVAYNDGTTTIIEAEDLYDLYELIPYDQTNNIIGITRLSKELTKQFIITKIKEM